MQQTLIRLFILIKSNIISFSFFVLSSFIVISSIFTYKYENRIVPEKAGVFCQNTNNINSKLMNEYDLSDDFIVYNDLEQMYSDVIKNKILCGFIISDDISKYSIKNFEDYKVDFLSTANNNRAQAYKEVFFDIFINVYNDEIIEEIIPDIFETSNSELTNKIKETKNNYLKENSLFSINIIDKSVENKGISRSNNLTKGLLSIYVFISVIIGGIRLYEEDKLNILNSLNFKNRISFKLTYLASFLIPNAIVCYVLSIINGIHNNIAISTLKMFVLCMYSIVWVYIVHGMIKSKKMFYNLLLILLPLMLIICPVIINIGIYIPAVRILKYIFPISLYM